MRFSAVDASFSKHTIWRDGYFHLLTTRDGDNRMLPLAWALCETESGDTYKWFAEKCTEAGLSRYLNNASIIFSDRQKGLHKFHEAYRSFVGSCFKHIIENCRKHIKGTGYTFPESMEWVLQSAPTGNFNLKRLGNAVNPQRDILTNRLSTSTRISTNSMRTRWRRMDLRQAK